MHHKYIREKGVDEFVERCKEVVELHDKQQEELEYMSARLLARRADSVERHDDNI